MDDAHPLTAWLWDEPRLQTDGEDGGPIAAWSLADFPDIVPAESAPA